MFVHSQVKQKTKKLVVLVIGRIELKIICIFVGLPADVLWGSFVTHSFVPHVGEIIKSQNAPLNGIVEVLIMVSSSVVFVRSKATYILQLCIL